MWDGIQVFRCDYAESFLKSDDGDGGRRWSGPDLRVASRKESGFPAPVPAVVVSSLLSQLPSPSCMLNNESCPISRGWEADWSVLNSTAMMAVAESLSGFKPVHKWGYVTLDWQAGMLNWLQRPPGEHRAH